MPTPTQPQQRRNLYPQRCHLCNIEVEANAGWLIRNATNSGWLVQHETCPPQPVAVPTPTRSTSPRLADSPVPAGHFAVPSTGHNDLDFYRVDRPTTGRYAGLVFVKRVIGGRPARRINRTAAWDALNRIQANGVVESAHTYARELGRCYRCNRHLTDELSRQLGIGPDCRQQESLGAAYLRNRAGISDDVSAVTPFNGHGSWAARDSYGFTDDVGSEPPLRSELGTDEVL